MPKLKLNCQDLSILVQSVTKTRLDNHMVDHIDTLYTKNETEYPCLIELRVVYDEN